jgi:hypothetical protein
LTPTIDVGCGSSQKVCSTAVIKLDLKPEKGGTALWKAMVKARVTKALDMARPTVVGKKPSKS